MEKKEYTLNIKALAAMMNCSVMELGEKCGIKGQHLKDVMYGRSKMTALDLKKLCDYTGVPYSQIQTEY